MVGELCAGAPLSIMISCDPGGPWVRVVIIGAWAAAAAIGVIPRLLNKPGVSKLI